MTRRRNLILALFLVPRLLWSADTILTCAAEGSGWRASIAVEGDGRGSLTLSKEKGRAHGCSLTLTPVINEPDGVVPGFLVELPWGECAPALEGKDSAEISKPLVLRGKYRGKDRTELTLLWRVSDEAVPCGDATVKRVALERLLK